MKGMIISAFERQSYDKKIPVPGKEPPIIVKGQVLRRYPDSALMQIRLAEDTDVIGLGYKFKGGTVVEFWPDGSVASGYFVNDLVIHGCDVKAGSLVKFNRDLLPKQFESDGGMQYFPGMEKF